MALNVAATGNIDESYICHIPPLFGVGRLFANEHTVNKIKN